MLTYYSETGLASGLVAVLFGTLPFFVFGLSAVLAGRALRRAGGGRRRAGAGRGGDDLAGLRHARPLPFVLAALGASALSAFANVELKRESQADPFRTLPPAMLLSGVGDGARREPVRAPDWARGASPASVGAVLYLGVLGSSVAFYLNHWLLQRLPTWVIGLSALIIPVIAVAVGALFARRGLRAARAARRRPGDRRNLAGPALPA